MESGLMHPPLEAVPCLVPLSLFQEKLIGAAVCVGAPLPPLREADQTSARDASTRWSTDVAPSLYLLILSCNNF